MWPPLNRSLTSGVRAASRLAGRPPQVAVRHLPRVGETTATLPDGRTLRMWSRGDDWVSNQVFWGGWDAFEPETTRVFRELALGSRVTLDVGAYVGYYALLAAHSNPAGQVLAFEPLPAIADRLRRNVTLNALGNVSVLQCAASERGGTAEFFHVAGGELPSSSSLSEAFMAVHEQLTSSRVEVVTIDEVLQQRGVTGVDLVKLDTETTEPDVLRGMAVTLDRDRPDIVCEVLEGADGTVLAEVLEPFGYAFAALTPGGPVLEPCPSHRADAPNHLFSARDATRRRFRW